MTTLLGQRTPSGAVAHDSQVGHAGRDWLLLPVAALLLAACSSLARVFVGLEFLGPVLSAAGLSLAVSWGARRFGAGPVGALLITFMTWLVFVGVTFAPTTLAAGLLPTPETAVRLQELWGRGLELIRSRPAPVFAEEPLLLIATTGVWAVTHVVEGLVFRLRSPTRAIVMALVLWVVPLSMAPVTAPAWPWALPFMAAAAALLLASTGEEAARWGGRVSAEGSGGGASPLLRPGAAIASAAMIAGVLSAGLLPGFGQEPWYGARGRGGTTLTTNPIVDIRARLVATDPTPILRVASPRPLYLRVTPLDVYDGDREEWTNTGIRGIRQDNPLPFEVPIEDAELVPVEITDVGMGGAVLIPAPYQVSAISTPADTAVRYDRGLSTLTVEPGHGLQTGHSYRLMAAVPTPDAATLRAIDPRGAGSDVPPALVALPADVPVEVGAQARAIVEAAGARTAFDQALALQQELRSWTYSLTPPQGHGRAAMTSFLATRTGYCEQFAGTMAVMLRTLGIPARVAVGFTPGTPVEPSIDGAITTYEVASSNSHAWVEVLFPGAGWIAFEPTPRADGNVLVPTAENLAPSATVAQRTAAGGETALPAAEAGEPGAEDPGTDDDGRRLAGERPQATDGAPQPSDAGSEQSAGMPVLALMLGVVVLAGAAGTVMGRRGNGELSGQPAGRVLSAHARAVRTGLGVGVRPRPAETDHEYLHRLAGVCAPAAAAELADATARARWSAGVTTADAVRAESAAEELGSAMLAGQPRLARPLVRLRGHAAVAATDARARISRIAERMGAHRRDDVRWPDQSSLARRSSMYRLKPPRT